MYNVDLIMAYYDAYVWFVNIRNQHTLFPKYVHLFFQTAYSASE